MRVPDVFRGLPRQFWIQWSGTLVNRLATFVQPFLVLYLTGRRGLSVPQAGTVTALWGAGVVVGSLAGGWAADRLGRRTTITGGMVLAAGTLAALGAARGQLLLTVVAFLAGVASNLYRPASSALIADAVSAEDRPRAFGLVFWAINIGFSASAVLGGYLASLGFGLLFAVDAGSCLACGLIMYLWVPRDRPARGARQGRGGYRAVLADRTMVFLLLLTAGYSIVYEQAYVALPLTIRDAGLGTVVYGLVIAVNGAFIVLFQPWMSARLGHLPRRWVMGGASLVLGAGLSLTALAHTAWEFGGAVLVWSCGEAAMAGLSQAVAADLSSPATQGAYQGSFTVARSGSMLLGPLLGTSVYAHWGPGALWAGCLGAGVLLAAGYPLLVRRPADRGEPEPVPAAPGGR